MFEINFKRISRFLLHFPFYSSQKRAPIIISKLTGLQLDRGRRSRRLRLCAGIKFLYTAYSKPQTKIIIPSNQFIAVRYSI